MDVKLSIVTICYNNLAELKQTCSSVDMQVVQPYEHLIINGSTTDEIQRWLEGEEQPVNRKFISERDNGIADAFNKGVEYSTGDILLMLNSGDTLPDATTLSAVMPHFQRDNALMWLHGMYKFKRAGIWVTLGKPFDRQLLYRGMRSICHQTMYYRKELHKKYGLYDMRYKLAMDFDFVVRIREEKFLFMDVVLAIFAPGGTSMQQMKNIVTENAQIIRRRLGFSLKNKIWNIRQRLLIATLQSKAGKFLYKLKVKSGLENS